MRILNKIIVFICLFSSAFSVAQGEANIWYFGLEAGLSFNSGSPVALTNSAMSTHEGCAVLSNDAGELLMYTDGVTVYNRNHQIMQNGSGLLGHVSSTHSGTIVPLPGSNHLYYVFTLDYQSNPNGFRYSIVDMNLDAGFGAVTSIKNELIYTPSCEKVSVIKHANDTDFWIVTHATNSNTFYCHLLTSTGLSNSPVLNNIGATIGSYESIGAIKFSPDGTKLAVCHKSNDPTINSHVELFNFNTATGVLSNYVNLLTSLVKDPYGVEFSPNNSILYITLSGTEEIYQYDLTATDIPNSRITVFENSGNATFFPRALQLGPDGKIYVAVGEEPFIGAINNPNAIGLSCNFVPNAVDLNGKKGALGLPVFNQSYFFNPTIQPQNACEGEPTTFYLNNSAITNTLWNFGDGTTSTDINPTHTYTSAGTFTVSVVVTTPSGTGTNTRDIIIYSNPTLINPIVALKQCDDDNDGFSAFNLTEANQLLVASTAGLDFSYFESIADAENNTNAIANIISYSNQIVSNDTIYVRVQNANGCFTVATLNLIVSTTLIPSSFQIIKNECDDLASGSNTDGITIFDFSDVTAQIQALYPAGQLLDITYYQNLSDALAETNAIVNTSNYNNSGYPNSQNIYVRVDSQLNNECLGLGHHITLQVEPIPIVQPLIIRNCDDDHDGIFGFDTSTIENTLLDGLTNVTVQYTDSNGIPLSSPLPNPFVTNSQTINVLVTNNTTQACSYVSTIEFIVDDLPEAFLLPTSLTTVCDDEINPALQNGMYAFDTSTFQSIIVGTQTGMIVNYFDENGNPLSSPLQNPFVTNTQNVLVEVINPTNTNCKATVTIPFKVNPLPMITLTDTELICSDNPTFTKVIDAGLLNPATSSNYSYKWHFNGNQIAGATNYTLTINQAGIYSVEVINNNGCFSTRTITVTASNSAVIESIQVKDFSDNNTIHVFASGLGDYVYSLNGFNYQESPVFENITEGIYTLYIKDLKGCDITTETIYIMSAPKFFTPNNDGYNDFWTIRNYNPNEIATVSIFDRYGKLIHQFNPKKGSWDGKFNGKTLPATDYWYTIVFNYGRLVKGHFSLIR